ncbi:hypothetical protein NHP190012_07590 [Helicobacter sp. NHP19-012]|uniref:Poly E-rich protein n=1 Tax=Helicobacter gastrofelis TaxID=2849642 RepID=A0ABM7SHU9_9HELI|nr:hypothetical protein [Helicobacter sp. NHP19-012]BCZ19117.1 hypothetical protein NHP190012_07590 [Helicobacter sp. NHP19-012]
MKILLVNQNKMVGKLFENIAKKLGLELVAEEHVKEILPTLEENRDCFFFADDTAVDGEGYECLKPHLGGVSFSGLLLRKGIKEFGEFTHYIKKPFLPTDVLHILQRNMGSASPTVYPANELETHLPTVESDSDFFKDINSSLDQLEGLLDINKPIAQDGQKVEVLEIPEDKSTLEKNPQEFPEKEIEAQMPQESVKDLETSQEQGLQELEESQSKPEQEPQEPEPQAVSPQAAEAKNSPDEQVPQPSPLALDLEDLLPIDSGKDETHAGLEHDKMLEDLVQEDSPKAQDLMDSMQNMGDLMRSADHEIEEPKKPELQTSKEPPVPKENADQDPMDMLGKLEALEAEAQKSAETPQEPESESTEPTPQVADPTEEIPQESEPTELEAPTQESQTQIPTEQEPTATQNATETPKELEPQTIESAQENLEQLGLEDLEGLDNLEQESEEQEAQATEGAQVPKLEGLDDLELESTEPAPQPEPKAQEPQTTEEAQVPKLEGLDDLDTSTAPKEPEPQEQEPQTQESAQETPKAQEPQETLQEPLKPQENTQEDPELENQAELENTPATKDTQESQVELEKDPQEYENIEDIPEPVMSSVVDGSYEAPAPSPKNPQQTLSKPPKR